MKRTAAIIKELYNTISSTGRIECLVYQETQDKNAEFHFNSKFIQLGKRLKEIRQELREIKNELRELREE